MSYKELGARVDALRTRFTEDGPPESAIVALEADFHPEAVAAMLALIERGAVLIPLTSGIEASKPRFREIAQAEWIVELGAGGEIGVRPPGWRPPTRCSPASRTRGIRDWCSSRPAARGSPRRRCTTSCRSSTSSRCGGRRSVRWPFLLFDHIGGVNTMLYTLSNGGTLVVVDDRSPDNVCRAIEAHAVQLLPTSPTFLNLLLMSGAQERHDLGSLELSPTGPRSCPRRRSGEPMRPSRRPRCSRPTVSRRSGSYARSPGRTTPCS